MSVFPAEFLDQIRVRIPLRDLARQRTSLVRRGKNWFGCCPFHQERTPSFKIDGEHDFYYCFGCGAHGDLFSFVMELEKVNFSDAVALLAERAGVSLPHLDPQEKRRWAQKKRLKTLLQEAAEWFHNALLGPQGEEARAYLTHRGIDKSMWRKFKLGFSPPGESLATFLTERGYREQEGLESGLFALSSHHARPFARFRNRLLFPIVDVFGHCVGFGGRILEETSKEAKYINSPESPLFDKSALLYGYPFARQGTSSEPVLIVEGYLDVISLHQSGFERVVASLGTATQIQQVQDCWKLCAEPIVLFDGDAAGRKAADRLIERILSILKPGYSLKFSFLPEGEDPDSFVRRKGNAALQALLQEAHPLSEGLWQQVLSSIGQETPEQRAHVWQRVETLLTAITHPDIRRFYREDFRKKERLLRTS
ncbi:MAG: DNA primase, partial [Holosporales bacterium]|nr:DNA primase [Holosporales bacterium]